MMSSLRAGVGRGIGDVAAVLLLAAYAWIVWSAAGGSATGGARLDPTWAAVQQRSVLRVAVDVGIRPFVDQVDGELVGYDVELARAVAAKLGLGTVFVPTGFDALYDALGSGRADLIASALPYAPDQGFRARFSHFYFDAGQVLVVPSSSPIATVGDLTARRVGVALGSDADAFARRLARTTPNLDLRSSYDQPAQAITALRGGQLDAVICDNVSALGAVQGVPGLRIATALSSEPYVLAMPVGAFQLEAEVNAALEELQAAGFFAGLNARWFR